MRAITVAGSFRIYSTPMWSKPKRYYGAGHLHFITCSCYRRQPLLGSARRRDLFLTALEQVRRRYRFVVVGYVVMPEHIHLLVSEPEEKNPSTVMQALKLGLRDASWRGRSGNVNRRKAVCSAMPRDTSGKSGFTISMSGRNGNASRSCAICIAIR